MAPQHLFVMFTDRQQAVLASDLSFGGLKSDLGVDMLRNIFLYTPHFIMQIVHRYL